MSEENQKPFEVVDKRNQPQPASTESVDITSAADTPDEVVSAESSVNSGEEPEGKLPKVSLEERIFFCLNMLQESAWVGLGLIRDPMTEEFDKNLADAKISIDIVATMVASIEPRLDDSVRRDMHRLVQDLRLNYVKQSS